MQTPQPGDRVALLVAVLAWGWRDGASGNHQAPACRFLLPGDALTLVQTGSGSAVVRTGAGAQFVLPVGFLSERQTEVVK